MDELATLRSQLAECESSHAIELESLQHTHNQALGQVQASLENANAQLLQLHAAEAELRERNAALEQEAQLHSNAKTQAEERNMQLAHECQTAQQEKRKLLAVIEKAQSDNYALTESSDSLRKINVSSESSVSKLQETNAALQADHMNMKLQFEAVQSELAIVQQDRDYHRHELDRISADSTRQRKSQSESVVNLTSRLEETQAHLATTTSTLNALRSSHDSLTARYDAALQRISELTAKSASDEAAFRSEIQAQQRLVDLLEKREQDSKERLDQVEQEWNARKEEFDDKEARLDGQLERERATADRLRHDIEQLKNMLASGDGATNGDLSFSRGPRDATPGVGTPGPSTAPHMTLSPAASIASRLQKSGRSYTDIYSDYIKIQDELRREKMESERLADCLNTVLTDIEERAPILREQRLEYERSLTENAELSTQLSNLITERDTLLRTSESSRLDAERLRVENETLTQGAKDLGRQIRTLLKELAVIRDPSIASRSAVAQDDDEDIAYSIPETTAADDLISSELVTFTSISQLQAANQTLLSIVRTLSSRMESEEKRIEEAENAAVTEAHELIVRMKEELASAKSREDSNKKEREMLKRLLADKEAAGPTTNGVHGMDTDPTPADKTQAAQLRDLQAYRAEMDIDTQTIRQQLTSTRQQLSDVQVELARTQASKELFDERYRLLVDTNERQTREIREAELRNERVQASLAKAEGSTHKATEEIIDLQNTLDRLKHERTVLQAERNVWKDVEERLHTENTALRSERSHLSSLLQNLQSMHNDIERTNTEARKRLEEALERAETAAQTARNNMSLEAENAKNIAMRREIEGKDYQSRIDTLNAEHSAVREAHAIAKTKAEHLEVRVEELMRSVAAKEEKLKVYEGSSASDLSGLPEDQRHQIELANTRAQLSSARLEAEQAQAHVEQYKAISQSNEDALAELNATYEEYKRSMDNALAQKDAEIADLLQRVSTFTADLTSVSNENSDLHRQLESQRVGFEKERQTFQESLASLSTVEERSLLAQRQAQEALQQQVQLASEAHEKYEKELVAHAEDVKALAALKESIKTAKLEATQAKAAEETAKANLEASAQSWERSKEVIQKDMNELKKRYDELRNQNEALHASLEAISSQATRIQQHQSTLGEGAADGSAPMEGEVSADARTIEQLREVIRHLRREKEIVDLQLELSKQQESRMKQQLDQTGRSLDEARALLDEERQKAAEAGTSDVHHAQLLEKITELQVTRESNAQLREVHLRNERKISELNVQLLSVRDQVAPLNESLRTAQAELETRIGEIKLLEEDNARWKARTTQILQKYERIDPMELQNLKEELENVKETSSQHVADKNDLQAKLNTVVGDWEYKFNTMVIEKDTRFKKLQEVARNQRTQIEATNAASTSTGEQKAVAEKERDEIKAQLQTVTQAHEAMKTELQTLQSTLAELTSQRETLTAQSDSLNSQIATLNSQITALNSELAIAKEAASQTSAPAEGTQSTADIEAEITKRVEAAVAEATSKLPTAAPSESNVDIEAEQKAWEGKSEQALKEAIAKLEESFAKERKEAADALAAALAKQSSESKDSGSSEDQAAIRASIQAEFDAKMEEEVSKRLAASQTHLQNALQRTRVTHDEAISKMKEEHSQALQKATDAASKAAAEAASSSAPSSDEAIKAAVEKATSEMEAKHKSALKAATEQAEKQAAMKNKLMDNRLKILQKENANLKAAAAKSAEAGPSLAPAAEVTTEATTKPKVATSGAGLAIAGISSKASPTMPDLPGGRTELSIIGTANKGNSPTTAPKIARGRGRGRAAIMGHALAGLGGEKRGREDDGSDNDVAKRRKDGNA